MMKYQQLTSHDRYILSALKKQGLSVRQIADHMGRHRSTIYRELARNSCWVTDGFYRPPKADRRARTRRRKSRRNRRFTDADFAEVRLLLRNQWSPEQIVGRIGARMSHETIYRYVWRDRARGGMLWKNLRQSGKKRRKRYRAYDSRGRLADKRHISERPSTAESRRYLGHWEIDTVAGTGSLDCIVTLVERKSGYTLIGKLKDRTASTLSSRCTRLIQSEPVRFTSITADNGTEFHQYKKIERDTGTKFYFATPHHSWERGTVIPPLIMAFKSRKLCC